MTKYDNYVVRHYALEDGVLKRKVEYGSVRNVPAFVFFNSESGGCASVGMNICFVRILYSNTLRCNLTMNQSIYHITLQPRAIF